MKYILAINTTEHGKSSFEFSDSQSFPVKLAAYGLDITVNRSDVHSLVEYSISFIPSEAVRLHSITLLAPFAESDIGCEYPIYMLDNSLCTNTFATIKEINECSGTTRSREIVTAHGRSGNLNAAFTSFERFYTEFRTDSKAITAFYALEDKPVRPGEEYNLEALLIDNKLSGLEFFDKYADILKEKYHIGDMKPTPAGWSSWSCLYGYVTEADVEKQARLISEKWRDLGADLIQIDDGWQKGGSFGGHWTPEPTTFRDGIPALREKINDLGLRLGLWLSPGLIVDESEMFEELNNCLLRKDGKLIKSFGGDEALSATKNGSVYSLDIGKEETLEYLKKIFTRAKNEYGAEYFKIDFIMNLLLRLVSDGSRVEYDDGYSVELYRRYIRTIRETVGDDIFLLACGAPIGESVGIFDSIRISPDITWEGAGNPGHPGAWNILSMCACSAILRSPLHGKVFINDPDALLLRDFLTDKGNDGLALSHEEAKMWATVVAMSGGHILLNEEIDRLSPKRCDMFTSILPPLGVAARPRDFYEYPMCTESFIDREDAQLVALYNWGEKDLKKTFKNPFGKPAVIIDCWSRDVVGVIDTDMEFTLEPHTCRAFIVKPLTDGFLYSDGNFYLGLGERSGKEYYYYPNSAPGGYTKVESAVLDGLYTK
ncbi:MAG: alpha-galactosidase [Clostridia bacterium]|nr:alpha-galactosidase [Clostridia bacterium]